MRALVSFLVVAAVALMIARVARADDASDAEEIFHRAEDDDAALRFRAALGGYEASLARSTSFRFALRARARADALRDHAEGDFAPLARLETVRRDPHASSDPDALAALARDADSFPPGRVRVEARHLVAEAYLGRLDRPNDAVPLLRLVLADPAADPLTARRASSELGRVFLDRSDFEDAAAVARDPRAEPALRKEVAVRARRRAIHRGSIALLVAFAVLAAIGVARGAHDMLAQDLRPFALLALGFTGWIAVAGGALASSYEAGNAKPFVLLGLAVFPLVVLARSWALAGSRSRGATFGRTLLAAASVCAAAFLVLESTDVSYLQDFGL